MVEHQLVLPVLSIGWTKLGLGHSFPVMTSCLHYQTQIVDGRPTKDKVVWQGIVDVDNVRHAVENLRDTNWLYRTLDESSVDEAAKKTIKVAVILF